METIIIQIGIVLVAIFALLLGERGALFLPRYSRYLNRKPFSCRPCLTFWLQLLGMALIALIAHSWIVAISGVITAFVVFGIVWIIERKKVIN